MVFVVSFEHFMTFRRIVGQRGIQFGMRLRKRHGSMRDFSFTIQNKL